MSIRLLGVLPNPFGEPCPKATIRFTAIATEGKVLKGTDAEELTDRQGNYDFTLEEGRYLLEVQYSDELMESGSVLVDEFTPSDITLSDLIRYATPYTPPLIDTNPTDWLTLFQEVKDNDEWNRQTEQQVRDEDIFVNEDKSIHKDEESYLTQETITNSTGSSTSVQQSLSYKDATGREASYTKEELSTDLVSVHTGSESYSDVDTFEGSQSTFITGAEGSSENKRVVTQASVLESSHSSLGELTGAHSKEVTSTTTESLDEVSTGSAQVTERKYIDANALVEALLEQGAIVENVEAFDKLKVTAEGSQRDIQVDTLNVGETFSVDTKNDEVHIKGQLKISNADDYKGPVGDSQYLEYAYATAAEKDLNEWHIDNPNDPYDVPDEVVWRKHRTITVIDGITTEGVWSNPYLLTGADGAEGDTLYWVYKYGSSETLTDPLEADPDGWFDELKDGLLYRIERLVSNGAYQGTWSTPAQIAGADGDNGELVFEEYMYSPYGTTTPTTNPAHWHTNFSEGDFYRSSRLVKYAAGTAIPIEPEETPLTVTEWTTPTLITPRKGFEYFDGSVGAGSYVMEVPLVNRPVDDAGIESLFRSEIGRDSSQFDVVTFQGDSSVSEDSQFADSYMRNDSDWTGNNDIWEEFALKIDGNALINGTLAAETLKSGTSLTDVLYVSSVNSKAELTLSGSGNWVDSDGNPHTSDYRQWAGNENPELANYSLDKYGNLNANNVDLTGHVVATSGTFSGDLSAAGGTFSGDLSAAGGTFTGTLNGVDGNFTGTVQADKIIGDVVSGLLVDVDNSTKYGYYNNTPYQSVATFTVKNNTGKVGYVFMPALPVSWKLRTSSGSIWSDAFDARVLKNGSQISRVYRELSGSGSGGYYVTETTPSVADTLSSGESATYILQIRPYVNDEMTMSEDKTVVQFFVQGDAFT